MSGPRSTPKVGRPQNQGNLDGFPTDRRVDVWALTTIATAGIDAVTARDGETPRQESGDGSWSGNSVSSGKAPP